MSVPWKIMGSVDQLKPFLVAGQVNAINSAALENGQGDRFEEVMPTIVERIRTKIASSPKNNVLSATPNSVPPECEWIAAVLIAEAMQSGIPGLELSEDQVRMVTKAEKDLEAITAGRLLVSEPEDPLTPSPVQDGGRVELVHTTTRPTRESLSGL